MKVLTALIPFLLAFSPFDTPKGLVEKGNRLFLEERYAESLEMYSRAMEIADDDAPIQFNIGNALYRMGKRVDALKAYRESAAYGRDDLRAASFYNMGNALFKEGKYGEAADSYREALRIDPSDVDAKINLELALKRLKESRQSRSGRQWNEGKTKNGKNGEKGGEDAPSKGGESTAGEDGRGRNGAGSPMTKEEAKRLLDSMTDGSMDLQIPFDMIQSADSRKVGKDW